MTRYAALLVGLVMAVLGIISYAAPTLAVQGVHFFHEGSHIYLAAVMRLMVGALFIAAAKSSRARWLMYTLGVSVVIGGVVTPFLERPMIDLLIGRFFGGFAKPWSLAGVAMGLLVVYAVVPPRDTEME